MFFKVNFQLSFFIFSKKQARKLGTGTAAPDRRGPGRKVPFNSRQDKPVKATFKEMMEVWGVTPLPYFPPLLCPHSRLLFFFRMGFSCRFFLPRR